VIRKPLHPGKGMQTITFFVQIKTDLGKAYDVATAIADAEIASEIYSTAGGYDLLVKKGNKRVYLAMEIS